FSVLSHGAVTIGVLNMFIQYSQRFWRPIQDLSDKYNILQAAMAACERIFKLLDTPAEIVSPEVTQHGDGSNRIEFRHVWFTYQKLTDDQRAAVASAGPGELAAVQAAKFSVLKGHDFSRAAHLPDTDGALAPEGMGTPDPAKLAALPDIEWILK